MMGGVSSTQTILSFTNLAFLAIRGAAILPVLHTWLTCHVWTLNFHLWKPSMIIWIELGGEQQLASKIPSSKAFASTSNAPKGKSIFLLITPMRRPLSFLIIPIPQLPDSLNTASSSFTLYHPSRGGVYPTVLSGALCLRASSCSLKSSTRAFALETISFACLVLPSNFATFLLFQMHHIVHARRSHSISFWSSQIFYITSINSRWGGLTLGNNIFVSFHTASSIQQSHKACPEDSLNPHNIHSSSVDTFRRQRQ